MLTVFKRLIDDLAPQAATPTDTDDKAHQLQLVTGALLVEVMRADFDASNEERDAMLTLLRDKFSLRSAEAEALVAASEEKADAATSLYEFTGYINDNLDAEQKAKLIELMWEVAFADGRVDRYEDYVVRKVAELIHVPHSTFIQTKLQVSGKNG